MTEPFLDYLATEFMKDYHGDKEHHEDAFDGWLSNLDGNDLIEYGNKAFMEAEQSGFQKGASETTRILVKANELLNLNPLTN